MQQLHFSTLINASREKVWQTMLSDATYRDWTGAFMPGSHFVGDWSEGSKIQFLAADEKGVLGGMTSKIIANRPPEFVSVQHLGIVSNGVEDTTSPEATKWAGLENYTFIDKSGQTELQIDVQVPEDAVEYMTEVWQKALARLKELAEK